MSKVSASLKKINHGRDNRHTSLLYSHVSLHHVSPERPNKEGVGIVIETREDELRWPDYIERHFFWQEVRKNGCLEGFKTHRGPGWCVHHPGPDQESCSTSPSSFLTSAGRADQEAEVAAGDTESVAGPAVHHLVADERRVHRACASVTEDTRAGERGTRAADRAAGETAVGPRTDRRTAGPEEDPLDAVAATPVAGAREERRRRLGVRDLEAAQVDSARPTPRRDRRQARVVYERPNVVRGRSVNDPRSDPGDLGVLVHDLEDRHHERRANPGRANPRSARVAAGAAVQCTGRGVGLAAVGATGVAVAEARVAREAADARCAGADRVGWRRARRTASPAVRAGDAEVRLAAIQRVAVAVAEARVARADDARARHTHARRVRERACVVASAAVRDIGRRVDAVHAALGARRGTHRGTYTIHTHRAARTGPVTHAAVSGARARVGLAAVSVVTVAAREARVAREAAHSRHARRRGAHVRRARAVTGPTIGEVGRDRAANAASAGPLPDGADGPGVDRHVHTRVRRPRVGDIGGRRLVRRCIGTGVGVAAVGGGTTVRDVHRRGNIHTGVRYAHIHGHVGRRNVERVGGRAAVGGGTTVRDVHGRIVGVRGHRAISRVGRRNVGPDHIVAVCHLDVAHRLISRGRRVGRAVHRGRVAQALRELGRCLARKGIRTADAAHQCGKQHSLELHGAGSSLDAWKRRNVKPFDRALRVARPQKLVELVDTQNSWIFIQCSEPHEEESRL